MYIISPHLFVKTVSIHIEPQTLTAYFPLKPAFYILQGWMQCTLTDRYNSVIYKGPGLLHT